MALGTWKSPQSLIIYIYDSIHPRLLLTEREMKDGGWSALAKVEMKN